jgi:hypothetical protein
MIKVRRKSILYGIIILATAAVAVINVNLSLSQPEKNQSSVTLKKIEALSGEKDEDKGAPNCEQHDTNKIKCEQIVVTYGGRRLFATHKRNCYCKSGGRNTKCTTGSAYWVDELKVSDSITEIDCPM